MTNPFREFLADQSRDITVPYISAYNTQEWYNLEGEFYRANDLPNVVYEDGTQKWFNSSDRTHRTTGPAIIAPNGREYYFLDGVEFTYEVWLEKRVRYLPKATSRYERSALL